jgi:hypothetical protein
MLHNAEAVWRAQTFIVVMCTALLELADSHQLHRELCNERMDSVLNDGGTTPAPIGGQRLVHVRSAESDPNVYRGNDLDTPDAGSITGGTGFKATFHRQPRASAAVSDTPPPTFQSFSGLGEAN